MCTKQDVIDLINHLCFLTFYLFDAQRNKQITIAIKFVLCQQNELVDCEKNSSNTKMATDTTKRITGIVIFC